MISSVAEHYANHLAPIYSWMVGDFEAACSNAESFYSDIPLPNGNGRIAIDLGCGHGVHSIPLARRGFDVFALDTSQHLLAELEAKVGKLSIKAIAADLIDFKNHLGSDKAALISCMGDTLTHLPSVDAVRTLIRDVASSLAIGGWLTLSFRDYSHELKGASRFIPIRADERRIHTCFLEYLSDVVVVHDIIHSLNDSAWQTSVSGYPKLRLSPDTVVAFAESNGLSLAHKQIDRGLHYFAFDCKAASAG